MEEQKNYPQGQEGKMCSCGNGSCRCGWHGMGHRHSIVRIVIALLVALFVFWVGVKVGEVRTSGRGGFNRGYMMYRGYPPGYAVPVNGAPAPTATVTSTVR